MSREIKGVQEHVPAVDDGKGRIVSTRTKSAFEAERVRGTRPGCSKGSGASERALDRGQAVAQARAAALAPLISELQAEGVTSLVRLAKALTERGVETARGGSHWGPTQVARVLERIKA